jgi:Aerotolerance regulator N-terminal
MPWFSNPLGLLALLGIPAVLAIHFLQRKAREFPCSTLFLLETVRREAAGGRRIERLLPSVPLWMQLLMVLLLAWLLAEPRFTRSGSIQRVAVVMDSSASMSVFKEAAADQLAAMLPGLRGKASELRLTILESAPERPRIHAADTLDGWREAIAAWQPREGPLDPTQALRQARSLVSTEGTVLYLTDTPPSSPLPSGAIAVAVGEAIDNVGFAGVGFTREQGAVVWKALVKNHGTHATERSWSIHTATGTSTPRTLKLEPGAMTTLQGAFPKDAEQFRIVLSPDRFTLDDELPLVEPVPKRLTVGDQTAAPHRDLASRMLKSLDAAAPAIGGAMPDLVIASCRAPEFILPKGGSIVFTEGGTRDVPYLSGVIASRPHPLTDGLNWQPLLARATPPMAALDSDLVLVWQGERPLVLLREDADRRALVFNFDPALSNLATQTAFIVMAHRFAEQIRDSKVAPVAENLETGQSIRIANATNAAPPVVKASDAGGRTIAAPAMSPTAPPLRAIDSPGFMTIEQGGTTLLKAAVHFGDPREADFTRCASATPPTTTATAAIERHTRPDPWWKLWLLATTAALLVSWRFAAGKSAD